MKMIKLLRKCSSTLKNYQFFCSRGLFSLSNSTRIINKKYLLRSTLKRKSKHLLIVFNAASYDILLKIHMTATIKDIPEEAVDEDIILPSTKPTDVEDRSESFRNTLFPHSTDPVILKLKSCYSIQELHDIVKTNVSSFTTDHYIQLLLVLWDAMRYSEQNCGEKVYIGYNTFEPDSDINNLILKATDYLNKKAEFLSPEVLACSLLYSYRLGIPLKHPTNQGILMRISSLLDEKIDFPLHALSRLTIALIDDHELWSRLLIVKVLPYIHKNIEKCNNLEDFRALTITMLSSKNFLTEEMLVQYEMLTDKILKNGTITKNESSVVIKTVSLLNSIYYRPESRLLTYKLYYMIKNNVDKLFVPHLLDLQKIILFNPEPHYILRELNDFKEKYTESVVKQSKISTWDYHLIILPAGHQGLDILKEGIKNINTLDSLLVLMPHITTAHIAICNMFWDKVTFLLNDYPNGGKNVKLLHRIGNRYLHFTNFMKMYYHRRFESQMLSLITSELVGGTVSHNPKLLAMFATFVLAFDHRHRGSTSLSSHIVPHIINLMSQFESIDCLLLSKGLKQGLSYQKSNEMKLYLQLDAALSNRTREIINTEINLISVDKFNILFRILINSKGTSDTDLFNDFLTRIEHLNWNSLTSRSLKNMVYNLMIASALAPSAIEHMIDYCLNNSQQITGETAGKLAFLCYCMGYTPVQSDSFLGAVDHLISRDWKMINGLNLLQVALALSYFNKFPKELNNSIFTVEFLERLDEEIKNCYGKDKYPLRVRRALMELNRSVCLDHPEANVPWFHSKFCEEQQALDVQINLDDKLKPMNAKAPEDVAHRLAFLLHYNTSFTTYTRSLKGYNKMKQRHLEILGYKVLSISDSEWNAMYMAEPKAKIEYLKNLIWPP